jgi:hypothetical protein
MFFDLMATCMNAGGEFTVQQQRFVEARTAQEAAMNFVAGLSPKDRGTLVDVSASSSVEIHMENGEMKTFCSNEQRYLDVDERNYRPSFYKSFPDKVVFLNGREVAKEPESLAASPRVREIWKEVQA